MEFFQPGGNESDISQACPPCGAGQPKSSRYTRYLCPACASLASDESGRLLTFQNAGISGGFRSVYGDTGEERQSHVCFVSGVPCWADEARFGGIVIQPKSVTVINSWQISVAAESLVASLFARIGYDVSVRYGANQPEYDLMIARGDQLAKVSVKGSQDGSWGLTQKYMEKKTADYLSAIGKWEAAHSKKTIFALTRFQNVSLDELPRVYLATPREIASRLREARSGKGDTILHENKEWGSRAFAAGTVDAIPISWRFSEYRVDRLINQITSLAPP